jgi:hypothetical protein
MTRYATLYWKLATDAPKKVAPGGSISTFALMRIDESGHGPGR